MATMAAVATAPHELELTHMDAPAGEGISLHSLQGADAPLHILAAAGEHMKACMASSSRAAAAEAEARPCWGLLLTGNPGCSPGFKAGTGHFKNHFCPSCARDGLRLDPAHARLLPESLRASYLNPTSHGLWATVETPGGMSAYRVVNQTAKCTGPPLILTREASSALALDSAAAFPPIPQNYLQNGELHLALSKGTLVPVEPIRQRRESLSTAPAPQLGFRAPPSTMCVPAGYTPQGCPQGAALAPTMGVNGMPSSMAMQPMMTSNGYMMMQPHAQPMSSGPMSSGPMGGGPMGGGPMGSGPMGGGPMGGGPMGGGPMGSGPMGGGPMGSGPPILGKRLRTDDQTVVAAAPYACAPRYAHVALPPPHPLQSARRPMSISAGNRACV